MNSTNGKPHRVAPLNGEEMSTGTLTVPCDPSDRSTGTMGSPSGHLFPISNVSSPGSEQADELATVDRENDMSYDTATTSPTNIIEKSDDLSSISGFERSLLPPSISGKADVVACQYQNSPIPESLPIPDSEASEGRSQFQGKQSVADNPLDPLIPSAGNPKERENDNAKKKLRKTVAVVKNVNKASRSDPAASSLKRLDKGPNFWNKGMLCHRSLSSFGAFRC